MKLAIIASSGGGVFREVYTRLISTENCPEFIVITDRPCGIESFCKENSIKHIRIVEKDRVKFGRAVLKFLRAQGGVEAILLFYLRLVSKEIFTTYPTYNFHPSLLPLFGGLGALKKLVRSDFKFIGATVHLVDESVDNGAIVGQMSVPFIKASDSGLVEKLSYIQKVYLMYVLIELILDKRLNPDLENMTIEIQGESRATSMANPSLTNLTFRASFEDLIVSEGLSHRFID